MARRAVYRPSRLRSMLGAQRRARPGSPGPGQPGAVDLGQGPGGSTSPFDYSLSTDPEYAGAQASASRDVNLAESHALAQRRRLLAQLGDRGIAASVLGENDPSLGAISDDPNASTSTLAQMRRGQDRRLHSAEDNLNARHLFYSSTRGDVLNRLNQDFGQERAGAVSSAQGGLAEILDQLLAARTGAQDRVTQALLAARARRAGSYLG